MQDLIDRVITFDLYSKCNKKKLKDFKYEYYRLIFAFPEEYSMSFVGID